MNVILAEALIFVVLHEPLAPTAIVAADPAVDRTSAPVSASPSPDSNIDAARALFNEGQTHYALGEYDAAIARFRRAYELSMAPGLLFNIAQAYRLSGACVRALEVYKHFIRLNPESGLLAEAQSHVNALKDECARDPVASGPPEHPAVTAGPRPGDLDAQIAPGAVAPTPVIATSVARPPRPLLSSEGGTAAPRRYAAVFAGGATGAVARNFGTAKSLLLGVRPDGTGLFASVAVARASQPGLAESQGALSLGGLWMRNSRRWAGWVGASVGVGAIVQTVADRGSQWSGIWEVGPLAGGMVRLADRWGLFAEAQLWALGYRAEARNTFSLTPAGWVGLSLGL